METGIESSGEVKKIPVTDSELAARSASDEGKPCEDEITSDRTAFLSIDFLSSVEF